jgi:hypothetical protein
MSYILGDATRRVGGYRCYPIRRTLDPAATAALRRHQRSHRDTNSRSKSKSIPAIGNDAIRHRGALHHVRLRPPTARYPGSLLWVRERPIRGVRECLGRQRRVRVFPKIIHSINFFKFFFVSSKLHMFAHIIYIYTIQPPTPLSSGLQGNRRVFPGRSDHGAPAVLYHGEHQRYFINKFILSYSTHGLVFATHTHSASS